MSELLASAVLALQESRLDEALALLAATGLDLKTALDRAFAVVPPDADAVYNAGVGLYRQGQVTDALACFDRAIGYAPDHLPALANRGTALNQLDRFEEALAAFERALDLAPDHPALLDGKGDALVGLKRMAEAREAFRALTASAPERADGWAKLGAVQASQGDLEAALAALDRALALDPARADAAYARGNVLRDLGRFDAALKAYDRAIALGDPVNAPINKALLLMLLGDYDQGLPLYETRWRSPQSGIEAPLDPALWGGRARLAGKRLLLRAEQGLGDTLQMLRYVPVAAEAGAEVWVQVPRPLVEIARSAPGAVDVLPLDEAAPKVDIVCPMMSLPLLLGRRPDAPGPSAYLQASYETVRAWRTRLGDGDRRRIGLAWSGSALHHNDRNRSLPFAALEPLLKLDADFVSLQTEYRPGDAAWLASSRVRDVSGDLKDFAETAGLIEALDLVITADTAVAHLAGALGKPVWILLPFVPDFRWGLGSATSPLYPSARLFRQASAGAWDGVIAEVVRALRTRSKGLAPRTPPRR
jgi:tetratricopeptide (TPR) repeat protein